VLPPTLQIKIDSDLLLLLFSLGISAGSHGPVLLLKRRYLVSRRKSLKLLSLFIGAILLPVLPCAQNAHARTEPRHIRIFLGLLLAFLFLVVGDIGAQEQYFLEETVWRLPMTSVSSLCADAADIDLDGDYDILASASNFFPPYIPCYLLVNDGQGYFSWESWERLPDTATGFAHVGFGPIDADDSYDMYLVNEDAQDMIFINDGAGYFADETFLRMPPISCGNVGFQFGDMSGDAHWDIITVCSRPSGDSHFLLNDGLGYFCDQTDLWLPEDHYEDYYGCLFDFDNDLDLDFFITYYNHNRQDIRGHENIGDRFIELDSMVAGAGALALDAADFDADGDLDLLAYTGSCSLLINIDGIFVNETAQRFPPFGLDWGTATSAGIGDFDNDNDIDIFLAYSVLTENHLLINDGEGYFTLADERIPDSAASYRWAEPFDADQDGDLDIFLSCSFDGRQRILINYGTAPDSFPPRVLASNLPTGLQDTSAEYVVELSAYDNISVEKGALLTQIIRSVDSGPWSQDTLAYCGGTLYSYSIAPQPPGTHVEYWLTLTDRMGNSTRLPTAPDSVFEFWIIDPSAADDEGPTPKGLSMSCYPNPFNSSTTLNFNSEKGGEIEIFDIKGQLIRTFLTGGENEGRIKWDATDATGKKVSSGTYLARLRSGEQEQETKLIYLK
jgi:hypothetical protein